MAAGSSLCSSAIGTLRYVNQPELLAARRASVYLLLGHKHRDAPIPLPALWSGIIGNRMLIAVALRRHSISRNTHTDQVLSYIIRSLLR